MSAFFSWVNPQHVSFVIPEITRPDTRRDRVHPLWAKENSQNKKQVKRFCFVQDHAGKQPDIDTPIYAITRTRNILSINIIR
jgi:hypothetical protein